MTYQTGYRFGPEHTHPIVKRMMWLVGGCPIVAALVQPLFTTMIAMPGPIDWFSLSWKGVTHFLLWQPFTYPFVEEVYGGLTLWFFVQIFFSVYLTWMLGSSIVQALGTRGFLACFFVPGFTAAILALAAMPLSGYYPILAGATPPILGMMVIWTMLHPEAEVLLFFALPLAARWLVLGILTVFFLIHASQGNLVGTGYYLGGAVSAYFLGLMAWDLRSPFLITHRFDRWVAGWGLRFRTMKEAKRRDREKGAKIFDFKTGRAVYSEEQFMDKMLSKISEHGEESLTWWERWKMRRISRNRNK